VGVSSGLSILTSLPVTKAIQNALHDPQILQVVDQIAATFKHHDLKHGGRLRDGVGLRSDECRSVGCMSTELER
jgi:hypothetical protein